MGNFFGSPEFKRALKKQSGGSVKKKKKSGRGRKHARKAAPRKRRFVKARGRHAGTTRKGRARRRVIRSKSRRHRVKGYTIKRGRRAGKRVKMHYSYEAAAFENPLSTGEVVVVGIIGVLGALVAQGADRFAATHALSGTIAADGGGLEDSPPQGKDYNANSVNAPMGLVRGAIAAGLALVPLVGAHFVRSPMARTSMQAFGFGALIRTGLKVGSDVTGWAMRKSAMGQRLFQPEIVAHALDKKFAADLKANKDLAALQGMPILGGVVSQSVSAGMLAQNANSRTPCQQMQQQFAPPPPPPPAGMGAPLYTPPAAAPAAEPPSASKPNGIVHHVSGGNLYNPSLRD